MVGLLREGEPELLRVIDGGGVDLLRRQDTIVDPGKLEFTENIEVNGIQQARDENALPFWSKKDATTWNEQEMFTLSPGGGWADESRGWLVTKRCVRYRSAPCGVEIGRIGIVMIPIS